jgi:hypothetical protein
VPAVTSGALSFPGIMLLGVSSYPSLHHEKKSKHLASCLASQNKNPEDAMSCRDLLSATAAATAIALSSPLSARAESETTTSAAAATITDEAPLATVSFGSKWSAVDGLNRLPDSKLVGFEMSACESMRDDPTRTPLFRQAILDRLGEDPESKVVLDLRTGPFALFAIVVAECGAGQQVHAMEASPEAAAAARAFVKKTGHDDIVAIVEGCSDKI